MLPPDWRCGGKSTGLDRHYSSYSFSCIIGKTNEDRKLAYCLCSAEAAGNLPNAKVTAQEQKSLSFCL